MKHNILVDLTWAWTYVSAEYRLYTFDEEGNVTNAKDSTINDEWVSYEKNVRLLGFIDLDFLKREVQKQK